MRPERACEMCGVQRRCPGIAAANDEETVEKGQLLTFLPGRCAHLALGIGDEGAARVLGEILQWFKQEQADRAKLTKACWTPEKSMVPTP